MTPKGVAVVVVITMIIVLIAIARDFVKKNWIMKKILLLFILIVTFSCSKETKQELFLEKVSDIVWTRGSNYKIFKNDPFRLILVEDGICLEFTENPKDIRGNEFQYTILKSGTDTLKLGYRVTGERLNHCGTFTYYLNNQGELFRTYDECSSIYPTSNITSFYEAEQGFDTLCPELQ